MNELLNLTIDVPRDVKTILDTLHGAGYEAFAVGGCVRDRLLGKTPDDWDITTSALPENVKSLFSATADTGIQHGTVMVIKGGRGYEVTTYRVDGKYKDGRHPETVTFTPSLEEDLKRRDFTINAFAYSDETGIVDLFDGIADLKAGIIRAVGDPRKRFDEDALRIMRAVRFSAQLDFKIEEETEKAISEFAAKLSMVSAERIRVEFEKTLFSANPSYVNAFRDMGLASYIIPEVSDRCFLRRSEPVWANVHGPAVTDDEKYIRLAAFFMGLSADECAKCMRSMTFDNKSRDMVCGILKYMGMDFPLKPVEVRRLLRETGQKAYELELGFAEASGRRLSEERLAFEGVLERGEAFSVAGLSVSGEDLIEAGIPRGEKIGAALSMLLDRVIEEPELNNKETLLQILKS